MVKASEPGYTMIPQYIIINSTSFRNNRKRLRPITPIDPSYFEGNMPRNNQSNKRRKLSKTSRSDRSDHSSNEDDEEEVEPSGDDSSRADKSTKSSSEESSANSSRDDRSNDGVSRGGSSESSSISMNNTSESVDKDSTSDFSGRYANVGARNVGSGYGMVISSVPHQLSQGVYPTQYDELKRATRQCVRIIERLDERMMTILGAAKANQRKQGGGKGRKKSMGKNKYVQSGALQENDGLLLGKLTEFVKTEFLPKWKFLPKRWDMFSEDPETLCGFALQYIRSYLDNRENKAVLWISTLAPHVNYKVANTRAEMSQGMRKAALGEHQD